MLRVLHILLAACVLLSTTGVVFAQHVCGGEVRSTAVFAKAEPCPHAAPTAPACPLHATTTTDDGDRGCCDDVAQLDKADDLLDLVPDVPALRGPALISALTHAVQVAHVADPTPVATWAARHYRPPPLILPTAARIASQVFRC